MQDQIVADTLVKHTPGPWTCERIPAAARTDADLALDDSEEFWIAADGHAGEVLAAVYKTSGGAAHGNAQVMKAAPDLYAALVTLAAAVGPLIEARPDPSSTLERAFVQAGAALHAAEGRD